MIGFGVQVEGTEEVLANLNDQIKTLPHATRRGLIKAGFFLQRKSQKIVPVDLGNLRSSAFTAWKGGSSSTSKRFKSPAMSADHEKAVAGAKAVASMAGKNNPAVVVGYSAYYAIYVHENLEAKHKKGKVAKFLERPLNDYRADLFNIIRKDAVKGMKKKAGKKASKAHKKTLGGE